MKNNSTKNSGLQISIILIAIFFVIGFNFWLAGFSVLGSILPALGCTIIIALISYFKFNRD